MLIDGNTVHRILQMREGGAVKRCHTVPHHGHYDVAQHTFNMLLLLDTLHPQPSRSLYRYILRHDLYERWTGDSPTVTKALIPELKSGLKRAERELSNRTGIDLPTIDPQDKLWVKALDWFEFLFWCDEQIGLGYKALIPKRITVWRGLEEMTLPQQCQELMDTYRWYRTSDDLSKPADLS